MKRIRALSGMRWLMPLMVFQTGYTPTVTAQETDDAAIEFNPLDFVPLEVGNRWIYGHGYFNEMYYEREWLWSYGELGEDTAYWEAYFKQFEIPGYPIGEPIPPESLTDSSDATLIVEITHTEWIDGFEYFVFSEASYDWPPLPAFFWVGQKVRWSGDGILFFRRNGADIPMYDFNPQYKGIEIPSEWYNTSTSSSVFEYIPIKMGRWTRDRLTHPKEYWDAIINPAYRDQILEVGFHFSNLIPYSSLTDWSVRFVKGYGIGLFFREIVGTSNRPLFWNGLSPISAILSGKEISYEEATGEFILEPELPTILGQLGKIRNRAGFDFSEGTESDFFDEEKDDIELHQHTSYYDGIPLGPARLISRIGMADLRRVDFGRLISEGPADLRSDPDSRSKTPKEGEIYAFWTREGGIALMHILEVVWGRGGGGVEHILFDWVYYPASDRSPSTAAVQPTSWGWLKQLYSGQQSPSRISPIREGD